jgi:hypothetical protein
MLYAIESPWLAFNLCLQKTLCVNPHMNNLPGFQSQLQLIGITALYLLRANLVNLGTFGGIVDQVSIEFRLCGRNLQLVR